MSHQPTPFNAKPQTAGGLAVYARYGSEYMSIIGRRGYEVTVQRHFNGDYAAANKWLAAKGQYATDEFAREMGFAYQFPDPGAHPAHIQKEEIDAKITTRITY